MSILRVAYVLNNDTVILNKGLYDGVKVGDKYLVYGLSKDEIIDPDSGKSLGFLEIIRGIGEVTFVQDTMCTLQSFATQLVTDLAINGRKTLPYSNAQVGDYAKPLNK
jgi:hypothetical protein